MFFRSSRSAPAVPAARRAAEASAVPSAQDLVALADAVERTRPIFDLLGAQLTGVNATTEAAALGFLAEMRRVDEAAGALVQEATRLSALTAEQTDAIARIAGASRGTGEVIDQLVEFIARRDRNVFDLVGDVRGLTEYVGTIQQIAKATTMLALNAKIEASRAGEHGAGFQVVADEVRDLSRQADVAARDIGQQIEHLAARLAEAMDEQTKDHASAAGAGPGEQPLTEQLQVVADGQRSLVERLETFTGRVENAAHELVANAGTVHGLTTSMMGGLQVQDVTRQVIDHVVGSMDELGEQFTTLAAALAGRGDVAGLAELGASLQRIQAGYVMHTQRAVHADIVGGPGAGDDGPAIELF